MPVHELLSDRDCLTMTKVFVLLQGAKISNISKMISIREEQQILDFSITVLKHFKIVSDSQTQKLFQSIIKSKLISV